MWTCMKCNERHEDQFDTCWKCAKYEEGEAYAEFGETDISQKQDCCPFDYGVITFVLSVIVVASSIIKAVSGSLGLELIAAFVVLALLCSILGFIALAIVYVQQKRLSNWAFFGLSICVLFVACAFSIR